MADTPSSEVTPPAPHPPVPRRPGEDDLLIDVAGFVRLLWRFRFAIVIATVAGGALGVAYARSLPPAFVGFSVLNLTLSPGTAPGAEQLAKFQTLVRDPGFVDQALAEAGLSDLAPEEVASAMSSRVIPPGTLLQVEARWSDAEIAGRLPSVLAKRAVAVLQAQHEQQQKEGAEEVAARQQSWADAELQVQRASAAFVEAWLERRVALSRVAPSVERALEETLEELRQLRTQVQTDARLRALETEAPAVAATAATYSRLSAQTQLRMAELENRRDSLMQRMSIDRPHAEIIAMWSALDDRQKLLELDLAAAREASTVAQKAVVVAKEAVTRGVGMELVEPSVAPGRRVGLATTAFLARGMATGLMFAVFAVFFIRGVSVHFLGRRT